MLKSMLSAAVGVLFIGTRTAIQWITSRAITRIAPTIAMQRIDVSV